MRILTGLSSISSWSCSEWNHFRSDRPPVDVQGLYQQAHSLRERLCANLVSAGLGRRYAEDMKFNEYGQVYF
jgi:hypothetical protein